MSTQCFNEYERKNTKQRISIEYLRDSEERLNPWDITNFISRVSTYMYKMELINTIAFAINSGVSPKDIFILDKAYKINGRYADISWIQMDTLDINKLFSIGKPVSMEPNKDIQEINYLFEELFQINKILYNYGHKRITKQERLDAFQILNNKNFTDALEYVIDLGLEKLSEKEKQNAYKRIKQVQTKIMQKYEKYGSNVTLFETLETKLERNALKELTSPEETLEKHYYARFYEYIIALPRPVVGIYYKEEKCCSILCADHFDNTLLFNTQIDLKSISQNSPIKSIIEGGVAVYSAVKEENRKEEIHRLEVKKKELEIEELQKRNELLDLEKIHKEIQCVDALLEAKMKADALVATEENLGIKTMTKSYAQRRLLDVYQKNQNGYREVMNKNQFVENNITVIDERV